MRELAVCQCDVLDSSVRLLFCRKASIEPTTERVGDKDDEKDIFDICTGTSLLVELLE